MGPCVPFKVARSRTQHVPEEYIKNAHWGIIDGDESYHIKSQVEGDEHWYPVEFIPNRACWVEIHWHENLEQGGHWEAFRIAGADLGLDIYPADVDRYVARQLAPREPAPAPENTTPSRPASPLSHSSLPSVIRVCHCYVFFQPYYTQIHRTAFFPFSPIFSKGFCTFTISSY